LPIQMKSKNVFEETIKGCSVTNDKAGVIDVNTDRVGGFILLGCIWSGLCEFNGMPFWIVHQKGLVSEMIDSNGWGNWHTVACQESSHGLGIAGGESNTHESICQSFGRRGNQLNVLDMIRIKAYAGLGLSSRHLRPPNNGSVEVLRLFQVVREERHVRNARDEGPRWIWLFRRKHDGDDHQTRECE